MTILSKSLLRRYDVQTSPDELAHFLGNLVSFDTLKKALDIATTPVARSEPVHIWVDGWCKNNGKLDAKAGWTVVAIIDGEQYNLNKGIVPDHGPQTNNVAEYYAIIHGLRWGLDSGRSVVIHTDSALVVEQVTKNWKIKVEHLAPLVAEARGLVETTDAVIVKEPREKIVEILGH